MSAEQTSHNNAAEIYACWGEFCIWGSRDYRAVQHKSCLYRILYPIISGDIIFTKGVTPEKYNYYDSMEMS